MPTTLPTNAGRPRAFVLRVWCDADHRLWGQIAEPLHDWRQPFSEASDLLHALTLRMAEPAARQEIVRDQED